jgi:hypothetical protein
VDSAACDEFDGRKQDWEIEMHDRAMRAALQRHWDASDAGDFEIEHDIYREDAVLDYPQSGERIRGRRNIRESRYLQPNKKAFAVRRMIGSGDLWISEFTLTYDGIPSCAVSIMEFHEGLVVHETQYFADRFDPGPSHASCRRNGLEPAAQQTPQTKRPPEGGLACCIDPAAAVSTAP